MDGAPPRSSGPFHHSNHVRHAMIGVPRVVFASTLTESDGKVAGFFKQENAVFQEIIKDFVFGLEPKRARSTYFSS